jgi:hypothetical protein
LKTFVGNSIFEGMAVMEVEGRMTALVDAVQEAAIGSGLDG